MCELEHLSGDEWMIRKIANRCRNVELGADPARMINEIKKILGVE
jgi:hypothetical protein